MFNYRWSCSGTLDQICEKLHRTRFHPKVFLIVSKGPGWYQIDDGTWLSFYNGEGNWQLYYWPTWDPRPFLRIAAKMKGF